MENFDPYNVFLAIAINIPQRLMAGFVLQGHICVCIVYIYEWMNEWGIYIVLYCVLLYTQSALQSCGGGGGVSPQPLPVCSIHLDLTAATGQRRQCAHHTPATGGEERET